MSTDTFMSAGWYTISAPITIGGNYSNTLRGVQPTVLTNSAPNDPAWASMAAAQPLYGTWVNYVGPGHSPNSGAGAAFTNVQSFNTEGYIQHLGVVGLGIVGTVGMFLRNITIAEDVLICNFDTGFDMSTAYGTWIEGVQVRGCNVGFSLGDLTSSGGGFNINTLAYCGASWCGQGLKLINANGNSFIQFAVQSSNGTPKIQLMAGTGGASYGTRLNTFLNTYLENIGGTYGIEVGQYCDANRFDYTLVGGGTYDQFHIVGQNNIIGPVFNGGAGTGMVVDALAVGTRFDNSALAFGNPFTISGATYNVIQVFGAPVPVNLNANYTPVTVAGAVATDQNLMSYVVPAWALNAVGKTLALFCAGTLSTTAATTVTAVVIKVKLGTLTLATFTSTAPASSQVTTPWSLTFKSGTTTSGSSGAIEGHGTLQIRLALGAGPSTSFSDVIVAPVSPIDLSAAETLQITVALTGNASASNTVTQRQMVLDLEN